MNKKFAASVLNRIHKQKISRREKIYFIARNVSKVTSLIIFLLFGMLAVAMVLHLANNIEFLAFIWDRPRILTKVLWVGVPFFWVMMAAALWIVTEKLVQKTDRAYRIPFWVLGITALLVQVGGGIVLEQSRVGERLDQSFENRMQWYQGAGKINRKFQRSPEQGLLAGHVLEIKSDELILLNDMTEKEWRVYIDIDSNPRKKKMEEGMDIRLVGEMSGEQEFTAELWRPARGGRPPFMRRPMRDGERPMRRPLRR